MHEETLCLYVPLPYSNHKTATHPAGALLRMDEALAARIRRTAEVVQRENLCHADAWARFCVVDQRPKFVPVRAPAMAPAIVIHDQAAFVAAEHDRTRLSEYVRGEHLLIYADQWMLRAHHRHNEGRYESFAMALPTRPLTYSPLDDTAFGDPSRTARVA